jgi:hypothetical protein
MNPYCEREPQVTAAILSGGASPEIISHARACSVCSEVLLVSAFLRETAALAGHELSALPDAGLLWRKAQALAREKAIAQAMLPIRIVRTAAYVAAAFFSLWLLMTFRPMLGKLSDIWSRHMGIMSASVERIRPAALNQTALFLVFAGTLVFLALSSWYMVREE